MQQYYDIEEGGWTLWTEKLNTEQEFVNVNTLKDVRANTHLSCMFASNRAALNFKCVE